MSLRNKIKHRPLGKRPYQKLFIIASEGSITEIEYFQMFNTGRSILRVKCIEKKSTKSAPYYVLKQIKAFLKNESFRNSDEAWLVVDKDNWTDSQLSELFQWTKGAKNYGFALSNPQFEYWLLLHFEDGNGIRTPKHCTERLEIYYPNYNKGIDRKLFPISNINAAIQRAKARDNPPCTNWPQIFGCTTVYKLVQKLI